MITIRSAGRGDIPALVTIDPLSLTDIDRRQSIARWAAAGQCFVAIRDDKPVGYAALTNGFFHQPFIEMLIVAEGSRRSGVGLALVRHCIELTSRELKLWSSTNASNSPMRALLGTAGFVQSGSIEGLDEGDPELVFLLRR